MNVARLFAVVTLTAGLSACNNSPQDQRKVREDTARTTATLKSDVKAAALGIRDGLRQPTPSSENSQIDINTASREQLESLPGITSQTARHIITHRPYREPADLRKQGILPFAVYDRIAPQLTASNSK